VQPTKPSTPSVISELERQSLGETPPVPPGEGPFHTKATGYLGHMKWVDESYPGGRDAFMAQISPPLRDWFTQQFFAMSFIDLMPLVCVGHTCARSFRMGFYDFIVYRSKLQAEADLKGMYRALLKLSSPRLLAARVPTILAQYFDFGAMRLLEVEPYRATWELGSIPVVLGAWMAAANEGFSLALVKAAGGVAPHCEVSHEPAASLNGYAACRLRVVMQWS
jgi:hypothetical protein